MKWIVLTVVAVAVVAAVAIPALLASRVASGESVAIGDLRSVSSSEVAYASMNGGAYAKLDCLATPRTCGFAPEPSSFLDTSIASLQTKYGYARSFLAGAPAKGKPDPGIQGFVMVATPVRIKDGSRKGLAIDHTGLMCYTTDGTPPPIKDGALAPTCTPLK